MEEAPSRGTVAQKPLKLKMTFFAMHGDPSSSPSWGRMPEGQAAIMPIVLWLHTSRNIFVKHTWLNLRLDPRFDPRPDFTHNFQAMPIKNSEIAVWLDSQKKNLSLD
jgi:hypothetical protein